MFSVIFEVHPKRERFDEYLDLAKHLRPLLERVDGFIDNERFESKRRPGWLLSHSTWRDEKSVVRWRTNGEHHEVQGRGRSDVFHDYHLRVGDVLADSSPPTGGEVRPRRLDETETGTAKIMTLTELVPEASSTVANSFGLVPAHLGLDTRGAEIIDHDVFSSINTEGKLALLASWRSADSAARWSPDTSLPMRSFRHRRVLVVRDYSMFDRREAPQYFPNAVRQ